MMAGCFGEGGKRGGARCSKEAQPARREVVFPGRDSRGAGIWAGGKGTRPDLVEGEGET